MMLRIFLPILAAGLLSTVTVAERESQILRKKSPFANHHVKTTEITGRVTGNLRKKANFDDHDDHFLTDTHAFKDQERGLIHMSASESFDEHAPYNWDSIKTNVVDNDETERDLSIDFEIDLAAGSESVDALPPVAPGSDSFDEKPHT